MHDSVRELALQVYKNICNNIFKLRKLLHITQEVGRHFISYCVPTKNVIHRTDAVHDFLQTLFHTVILEDEGTVMKISTKCNWCGLFQTMSELSG